jgi:hypothetical protein
MPCADAAAGHASATLNDATLIGAALIKATMMARRVIRIPARIAPAHHRPGAVARWCTQLARAATRLLPLRRGAKEACGAVMGIGFPIAPYDGQVVAT